MDQSSINHIKGVIEALLFVSERPVTLQQFKEVLDGVQSSEIRKVIDMLKDEYDERSCGMAIVELAGGYQMMSNSTYASYVRIFYKTKHKEKLSKPALETLAIVAYKQPVTRSDVELIRGVNSDGVMAHLLNKELIKIVGRKDVAGRPYLYGTTKQFMEYFGLKSLEDLPKIEDFPKLQEKIEAEHAREESQKNQSVETQDQDEEKAEDEKSDLDIAMDELEKENQSSSGEDTKNKEPVQAASLEEEVASSNVSESGETNES